MRPAAQRCRRPLSEEDAYEQFVAHFDLDVFALELEYNDRIGAMLREGVRRALDRKQRNFDLLLAEHPATVAEDSCRALARQLEEERRLKIAERIERADQAQARRLARRWHAKVASAHAS